MEAQILQQMIGDRDQRIALLERKAIDQKAKGERLANELEEVHFRHADAKIARQGDRARWLHEKQHADQALEELQNDLQQQGSSLATYSNIIKQEQGELFDSNYVIKMQAQLCKAMHNMGIIDHQLKLVKDACELNLKKQKETLARLTDEKTQLEMKMLNELMKQDNSRKEIKEELEEKLNDVYAQISEVRQEIEDNKDSDEESNAEPIEETEEDKQAKEELIKLLKEKKEEIAKLEKETEEQLVQIDDLRAQQKGISEAERKLEVEKKAQERAEEKAKDQTPPSTPKRRPSNPREEVQEEDDDDDDMGDVPVHVPLQNEKVLELARKRAEEKAAAEAASPVKTLKRQNSDDADEFDLLNLARMRLTGETNKARSESDEDSDEDDEEGENDEEEGDENEEYESSEEDEDIQEFDPSEVSEEVMNGHGHDQVHESSEVSNGADEQAVEQPEAKTEGPGSSDDDDFEDAVDSVEGQGNEDAAQHKVDNGTADTIESTDADEEAGLQEEQ